MITPFIDLVHSALSGVGAARRLLAFWGPVIDVPALVAPLLALGALVAFALLSGLAVSSMALLIVTLIALYLLLTDVFGLSIDVLA